ncbi:uncharacterized protein CLUP02_12674 [Colletotrichum lupini]|uniref:GLEYA adhesin domain-containing protein n=1 Tax=Colletotrichum lupini TaxID=145971 RepID=A0A9Q8WKQ0_9PEZI|nr:uncharacterized protein CLUP02_12674 [Colletotrichum lupini]UQC87173.1 hypothetical protein CLUP02_12674 [Colletotrichum lupini]
MSSIFCYIEELLLSCELVINIISIAIMKPRSILSLLFLSQTISASEPSFDHENGLPETWCFTYLSTYLEPRSIAAGSTGLETALNSTSIADAPLSTETTIGLSTNPTLGASATLSFSLGTSLPATEQIGAPATTPLTIPTSSLQLSSFSVAASDTSLTLLTTTSSATLTSSRLASPTATSSGSSTSISAQAAETVIFFVAPGSTSTVRRNLKKRVMGGFVNHNTNADRQLCNTATVFSLVAGELLDGGVPVYYSPGDSHKPLNAMGTRPNNAITTTFDVLDGVLRFYHPSLPGSQASFCQDATGQVHVTFTSRPPDCDPVSLLAYGVDLCQNGQIQLLGLPSQSTSTSTTASATSFEVLTSTTSRSTASVTSGLLQDTSIFSRAMSTVSSVSESLISSNSGPSILSFITLPTRDPETLILPSPFPLTLSSPSLSPSFSSSMLSSPSPAASLSPSLSPPPPSTTTFSTQTSTRTESTSSTSARFSNSTSVEASTFSASISDASSSISSSLTTSLSSSSSIITPISSTTSSSSSSLSSSSTSATPICTPGVEFAAYVFPRTSEPCQELLRVYSDSSKSARDLNLTTVMQGRTPLGTGFTPLVSWRTSPSDETGPTNIYGVRGPANTTWSNSCDLIQHRGYLKFNEAKIWYLTIDVPDDFGFVWFYGTFSSTVPGAYGASAGQITADYSRRARVTAANVLVRDSEVYVPFRALFLNAGGPGSLNMPLPPGVQFVSGCSDTPATPAFPQWETEKWTP